MLTKTASSLSHACTSFLSLRCRISFSLPHLVSPFHASLAAVLLHIAASREVFRSLTHTHSSLSHSLSHVLLPACTHIPLSFPLSRCCPLHWCFKWKLQLSRELLPLVSCHVYIRWFLSWDNARLLTDLLCFPFSIKRTIFYTTLHNFSKNIWSHTK